MNAEGPREGGHQRTGTGQSESYSQPVTPHETWMYGLGRRIRWLDHHRHWWLRTEEGQAQREFLDRRDAA